MANGILQKNYRTAASITDTGIKRKNNEDSILLLDNAGCYAVSDGMGGGAAGEIASSTVVTYIRNALVHAPAFPDCRRERMNSAVYSAHNAILQYAKKHEFRSMGATLAALLLNTWEPEQAEIYYAGDSRIYRLRGKNLKLLSSDHTVSGASGIPKKKLSPAIAGLLSNAVGIQSGFYLASETVGIRENDIFLLCSDGLYRQIPEERITHSLLKSHDLNATLAGWVKEANTQKGLDNLSAIVVRFDKLPDAYQPSSEEIKLNKTPEMPDFPPSATMPKGETML